MTEEKNTAPEASDQNASNVNDSPAAPAAQKEAEETKEKIDPRIVDIVGKEKIDSAFGGSAKGADEQPEEEEKPAEEKKEAQKNESKEDGQEKKDEGKEEKPAAAAPPTPKPTRLDRRLASLFRRNLMQMGEKDENIPTEEDIIADLSKYSKEEKIQAMHFHRMKNKELRGEQPKGDDSDLDEDDKAAIQDAERESIRQEILAEEYEKGVQEGFIKFIDEHTELLPDDPETKKKFPGKKKYDPVLAEAVQTLFEGGMQIAKAHETVMKQIQRVREAAEEKAKKDKSRALSGVLSGSGQTPAEEKELDWEEVQRIEKEDPQLYRRMLAAGKFKHLM